MIPPVRLRANGQNGTGFTPVVMAASSEVRMEFSISQQGFPTERVSNGRHDLPQQQAFRDIRSNFEMNTMSR